MLLHRSVHPLAEGRRGDSLIRAFLKETVRRNRLLALVGIAHFILFVLLIPAAILDPFEILGVSRWIKPMKFAISIAIFMLTMAWLLSYLEQRRRAVRVISRVIAITMVTEMALITMQSFRGVRSHFNEDSPFDAAVFTVMGLAIVINTFAVIYAWLLFLRSGSSLDEVRLSSVRFGLFIFVVASLVGGVMAAHGGHSVGVHDGSPGLPFVNWSTGAGDLRVAHFVGMHALQGIPILGWLLSTRRTQGARRWIQATSLLFLGLTILLTMQALAGRSVLTFY